MASSYMLGVMHKNSCNTSSSMEITTLCTVMGEFGTPSLLTSVLVHFNFHQQKVGGIWDGSEEPRGFSQNDEKVTSHC